MTLRLLGAVLLVALAAPLAAAQEDCRAFHVSPIRVDADEERGNAVFHVSGPNGCTYRLFTTAEWLTLGQDLATVRERSVPVNMYWEPNQGMYARQEQAVASWDGPGGHYQSVTIVQASARNACVVGVQPSSLTFPAEGGSAAVTVQGWGECSWTISSTVPWIVVPYGTHSGYTDITVRVEPNDSGAPRTAQFLAGGHAVTVNQENLLGERPGHGEGARTGNPVEDAAGEWLATNEEPGFEAVLALAAVGAAAVLAARRRR